MKNKNDNEFAKKANEDDKMNLEYFANTFFL